MTPGGIELSGHPAIVRVAHAPAAAVPIHF
jgi:hypothetical protein